MNRNSLRSRVTMFYVGMLALALMFFSVTVYEGARAYLTKSLERQLNNTANSIVADYVAPLRDKGRTWFVGEMSESYPVGISDPFVRVSQAGKVLYQSGDMRDPVVRVSGLPMPDPHTEAGVLRHTFAASGQPLLIYSTVYTPPGAVAIVVQAGASMEPLLQLLHSLFLILLISTPVILAASAAGGYVMMARPLRPVVVLTEQTEHVGLKQMGERLTVIPSGDELERLSLALNRMIDRLENVLAHNQRFSADASHELRTPLTIIQGELEAVLHLPHLPLEATDGISSALEEADRMAQIVHSLMTISRLDGGGERIEMQPVDLGRLLEVTLEHMSLMADEKSIHVSCEAAPQVYVMGDTMRLKQVIVNLVDNAIRYTPDGGAMRVRLVTEEGRAILTVSDNGIGIPACSVPLVFERFYRTDQARSRESGGTGLGLAIVKAICGAHEGSISVESIEGCGTTMRVELPRLLLTLQQITEAQLLAGAARTPQAQLDARLSL